MSNVEFALPELGDGIAEAEITAWLVEEGAEVAEHDPLLEVETDKAQVVIPAPFTGVLQRHGAAVGEMVKPDQLIATFAVDGAAREGDGDAGSTPPAAVDQPSASSAPVTTDAGNGSAPAAPDAAVHTQTPTQVGTSRRRALAAPTVRALARELGVELADVPGTGAGGRVVREDVEKFVSRPSTPIESQSQEAVASTAGTSVDAEAPTTSIKIADEDGTRRVPLRGLRRTIARRMTETLRTVPHVTGLLEIDLTDLEALLKDLRPVAEQEGVRLTWTAFFAWATIQALKQFPELNASLDDEHDEIVLHERIHLGIATATDDGLLVPVVRNADRLSLLELAAEIGRVSKAARDRSASMSELTGSTFTITNYGAVGGWHGTPMVNLPEIGIVGFGTVEPRPAVVDGALAVRTTVALSHTVDHRLIDGAINARFGAAIRRRLEQPQLLLLGVNHGNG
ncbi:dihydrolipoamide acetyltransferase family protein [Rhodococcoides fascians]|uniref:dihydrolipoamide acetyltransferase family protein n=1 Tax=Rhodococcoides fascians TaxID=1828 RepID=UPI002ACE7C9F|nr:dihydrolipoamide acetyltransferase family protein [Rhodococcus fascians]WQH28809.1 dihydrolipoamide acetyltransferase family protein [Rhodococcus fascians]